MNRILKTLFITLILSFIWQILEAIIYKKVQPRIVDDIMMLIFMPFIYKSTRKEVERIE